MIVEPRLTGITTPSSETLQTLLDMKYGRGQQKPLREVYRNDAQRLISLQQEEGFLLLSDGQRLWGDLLRPLYKGMTGVEEGSQTRWFESNGFCFPPRVVALPQIGRVFLEDYLYTDLVAKNMEVSILGPYSMLSMMEKNSMVDFDFVADAFANRYFRFMSTLPKQISLVEFIEPALALKENTKNEQAQRWEVAEYIYYTISLFSRIDNIIQLPPVDLSWLTEAKKFITKGYGLDLTENPCVEAWQVWEGKILSLGILDAWSSAPQDLDYAEQRVRRALDELHVNEKGVEKIYVTTNAQLYHTISHEPAMKKIKELGELARRLSS